MQRHYGMDWLRIGAFGLLILYHIGMAFVPWGYHVKTEHPMAWVEIPMLFINPWHLTLLFIVSGYASRALYARCTGFRAFLARRSARLLLPLLFGIAVIVPPQTWIEVTTQHGYAPGFFHFWTHDYFRFGTMFGIVMPTWNHLWFVAYLWAYTLGLALLASVRGADRLQHAFDVAFGGRRGLWVPLAFVIVIQFWLFPRDVDTHDLIHDGQAHLQYFPAFLFGFGLAGSRAALDGFALHWKAPAILVIGSYGMIAASLVAWPNFTFPSDGVATAYHFAREVEVWSATAALIGVAERFLNRDHRWRATLAEGTFPFYLIHQTIIVVVAGWLLPLHLNPAIEFVILLPVTVAGCWVFYAAGREINWLRPLIGLKRRGRSAPVPVVQME